MIDPRRICRVCGFSSGDYFPFGEDGLTPLFDFCACCGVEHGYQDSTLAGVEKYRAQWIASGYKWESPNLKPENWNAENQLKQVPTITDPHRPYLTK